MSSVAGMVTCALCGSQMDAEEQYCPKCGSLNAHYGYRKSPARMESGDVPSGTVDARVDGGVTVAQTVAAGTANRVRRTKRAGARQIYGGEREADTSAGGGGWEGPEPSMTTGVALMDRQQYGVDDRDVELPMAWRDGVVRVPRRRYLDGADGQQMYEVEVSGQGRAGTLPSPDTACILEMFGFVGFLGLGHMYGGRSTRGVLLMVLWWIGLAMWVAPVLLHITLLGVMWVLTLTSGVTWLSGRWIMNDLRNDLIGKS